MPLRAKDSDHFLDQLSLFAIQQTDTDISLAAIVIAGDGRYTATHQPNDPPTLDLCGSGDGGDSRSLEATLAGAQPGERTTARNALPTHDAREDGIQRSSGDRPERVECFAEPATPVTTLARDFRFPSNLIVGNGTPRQKAAANLEAIRLLQLLEREQRPASDEEKQILVRYTGWGALPQLFQPSPAPEWRPAASELKELLSEADYAAARASTPNAHYTSAPVITAIWETLARLGATSPLHILEPSLGIGHFFGLMPDSLAPNTVRVGIELDPLSARIAQFLYPDSQIRLAGFETVALPDGFFDVVIGNVPFGAYPVLDSRYKKHPALTRSIHDYFLAKSIDLVRPGGLLALITSRHTMDKQNSAVREYVASKANLVAAVRLPNGTFRANAGTDVTTDLLFLQRRESAVPEQAQPWLQSEDAGDRRWPRRDQRVFRRSPAAHARHTRARFDPVRGCGIHSQRKFLPATLRRRSQRHPRWPVYNIDKPSTYRSPDSVLVHRTRLDQRRRLRAFR